MRSRTGSIFSYVLVTWAVVYSAPMAARGDANVLGPAQSAVTMDKQIDWSDARLIAVQDGQRYKTLDSFARESISAMTGSEHFEGLTPMGSVMEWLFNRDAYIDIPVIKIRDAGVRYHFAADIQNAAVKKRIIEKGLLTPRELSDSTIQDRIAEMESKATMRSALARVREAQSVATAIDQMCAIVPQPGGGAEDLWFPARSVLGNLPSELMRGANVDEQSVRNQVGQPVPGLSQRQALDVLLPWVGLRDAWLKRDAKAVQEQLGKLATVLPTLAAKGVYPSKSQRAAEARYYAMWKMTWGWMFYLVGALVSVWAVVTRWRTPWWIGIALLVCALAVHGYGISLRWYILGRIPNANMFEAITFSGFVAIAVALVLELIYKPRVFLLGAHVGGFFALIVAGFVVPGGGTLTSLMGILDDIMLRIHTVLIITSYGLIFIASVVALVYLFGYYFYKHAVQSFEVGLIATLAGLWVLLCTYLAFSPEQSVSTATGMLKREWAPLTFWIISGVLATCAILAKWIQIRGIGLAAVLIGVVAGVTLAIGDYRFVRGMAWTLTGTGVAWAILNGLGLYLRRRPRAMELDRASGGESPIAGRAADLLMGVPAMATAGIGPRGAWKDRNHEEQSELRPILAGGAPGDENTGGKLPAWLNNIDWSHLIILNIVFIILFVAVILGAVWADYSWGRPWGWDPKEVFAMNTWLIYAVLIHTRFVTAQRGLWTAWLSVAGCLMMVFNWCFVNFFIVGLHSYA